MTLEAGQSVRYRDILGSSALGIAFPGNATIRVQPIAGHVMVTQRTYNEQATGTYGQLVVPRNLGVIGATWNTMEGRLIQLSESASPSSGFRTNMGFVNLSKNPLTVTVKLYRGDGTLLGTTSVDLRAYEYTQVGRILRRVTEEDVEDAFAVVSSGDAAGVFQAYASVIDNRSGDPTYIPAYLVKAR